MSKRTAFLILFLTLLTAFFMYLAISQASKPVVETKPEIVPTKKVSQAFTTLQLVPKSSGVVDVVIDTNGDRNKITAVQLELSYDPVKISNVAITPGTFIGTTAPLLNTVDQRSGRITYALAISPSGQGKTGEGVVATITYRPLFSTGTTEITVLPETLVTAEGISETVLLKGTGATLSASATARPTTVVSSPSITTQP